MKKMPRQDGDCVNSKLFIIDLSTRISLSFYNECFINMRDPNKIFAFDTNSYLDTSPFRS